MLFLSGFEHILDGCPCNLAARNFSYHSSGNLLRDSTKSFIPHVFSVVFWVFIAF